MSEQKSPVTGNTFYSGSVSDIKNTVRLLRIDEGRLANLTHAIVTFHQEMVDRAIDSFLESYYQTPLVKMRIIKADSTVSETYPGKVVMIARNWTSGQLVKTEFQQIEPSQSDAATQFIEDAKRDLFTIINSNQRLPGQILRSGIAPTMPPGLQPSIPTEPLI